MHRDARRLFSQSVKSPSHPCVCWRWMLLASPTITKRKLRHPAKSAFRALHAFLLPRERSFDASLLLPPERIITSTGACGTRPSSSRGAVSHPIVQVHHLRGEGTYHKTQTERISSPAGENRGKWQAESSHQAESFSLSGNERTCILLFQRTSKGGMATGTV